MPMRSFSARTSRRTFTWSMTLNQSPLYRRVSSRCGVESLHETGVTMVDQVEIVRPLLVLVPEDAVARDLLLVLNMVLDAVREYHIVNPLIRIPRYSRTLLNEFEIVLEGSFP